jgi:hypothetical protein
MPSKAESTRRLALGMCAACGNKPCLISKVSCQVCTDKKKANNKERNRLKKINRQETIAKGICPSCLAHPVAPLKKQCSLCLANRRKSANKALANPEYKAKEAERSRRYSSEHKDELKEKARAKFLIQKKRAFDQIGGAFCACCGEDDIRFLTIDHTNGDGAAHRKSVSKHRSGGWGLYQWITRDKPVFEGMDLQVLCFNCNCAKGNRECCPHKQKGVDPNQLCLFEVVNE